LLNIKDKTRGYGFGTPGKSELNRTNIYNDLPDTQDYVNLIPYETETEIQRQFPEYKDIIRFKIKDLKNSKMLYFRSMLTGMSDQFNTN